ncbi:MAG: phosphoribosylglycinamide formyltransferase [Spirochaetes bacterium]|nr:phosphoribosylglycinamide formyltransferase [Spirochaetota bacterium]
MEKKRIACCISGRGSNFKAILDAVNTNEIQGEIVLVVTDNPGAEGLSYAHENGIRSETVVRKKGEPRYEYFERIIRLFEEYGVDLICLAGFMKVLSGNIVSRYRNRIINIHPALLPSFPGEKAQRQAVEYGVKVSGCTVHFVDEGVDTGPIILQEAVPVEDGDTEETLAARILKKEHVLFPRAVKLFCSDMLTVEGRFVRVSDRGLGC